MVMKTEQQLFQDGNRNMGGTSYIWGINQQGSNNASSSCSLEMITTQGQDSMEMVTLLQ
jgi:hypothetical protein